MMEVGRQTCSAIAASEVDDKEGLDGVSHLRSIFCKYNLLQPGDNK